MSRSITVVATTKLIPSAYSVSDSSVTVTDPSNMYHNTEDSSSYATLTHTNKSTSAYYVYINGFNFSSIPSNATINSFNIKISGYEKSMSTSTSYAPRLVNGTTTLSNTTATQTFATSNRIISIPTGSYTFSTLSGYGSNFGISIPMRRNNKNTQGYVYIYGSEIEVTYTYETTEYDIISSDNASKGDLLPTGTNSIISGESKKYKITALDTNKISLKDNGVKVSLTYNPAVSSTSNNYDVVSFDEANSNYHGVSEGSYPVSNGIGGSTSSTETRINTNTGQGAETYFYYNFNCSSIPDYATITSVTCSFSGAMSAGDNTQYYTTQDFQLCSGTTPKGSSVRLTSSTKTTYTISNTGSWTSDELKNLKIRFYGVRGTSLTDANHYVRFFGATVTVQYYVDAYYSYEVSNISADHTLELNDHLLHLKIGSSFQEVSKVYKKVNNSWVEITDIDNLFEPNKIYIKKN